MRSMHPRNLRSSTVRVGWLVLASGLISGTIGLMSVWGIIDRDLANSIQRSIPYLNMILGPLAVHFRVNKRTEL